MAPLGSFYQLILTDQDQDHAIRDLYRKNGWTLHSKALSDHHLKSLLQDQDEDVVTFIQSTCSQINYPTAQQKDLQTHNQPANDVADNIDTDNFVVVKNEDYNEMDQSTCCEINYNTIQHKDTHPNKQAAIVDTENMNTNDLIAVKNTLYNEPLSIKREHEGEPLGVQIQPESFVDTHSNNQTAVDDTQNIEDCAVKADEHCTEAVYLKNEPENESSDHSEIDSASENVNNREAAEVDRSSSATDTCSEFETDLSMAEKVVALQQKNSDQTTADQSHSITTVGVLQKPTQVPTSQSSFSSKVQHLHDQYVQVTKMFYSTVSQMSQEVKLSTDSASMVAVNIVQSLVKTLQTAEEVVNRCTIQSNVQTKNLVCSVANEKPNSSSQVVEQSDKLGLCHPYPFRETNAISKRMRKRYASKILKEKFPCSHCSRIFYHGTGLRIHILVKHKGKPAPVIHDCYVCWKAFETKQELKVHRDTEHPNRNAGRKKQWHCKQCGDYLARPEALKLHNEIKHTEKDKFPCDICGKVFTKAKFVSGHKRSIHDEIGETSCETCGKTFNRLRSLLAHRKRHDMKNKKHMCEHCGKSFFGRGALTMHVRIHTGEKPFKCRFCNYASPSQANTRKHEKIHNKAAS